VKSGTLPLKVSYQSRDYDQIVQLLRQERRPAQCTALLITGADRSAAQQAAGSAAKQLGRTLYRVDLQAITNKYIGETEKNLERVFADAESSGAILYFDEADALFGSRSKVKDAHDRPANLDVGSLLQRLAEYRGLVIALLESAPAAARTRWSERQIIVSLPGDMTASKA
jgi:SpoVK/Ycf46/Vps4 family AAA+-type ATPase